METITFKKTIYDDYTACDFMENFDESHVQLLWYFLTEILTSEKITEYQQWAINSRNQVRGAGNESWLEKKDNRIIVSIPILELDIEIFFTIDSFVKMLEDWYNLVSQDAQRIVIHYDEKSHTAFVGTE